MAFVIPDSQKPRAPQNTYTIEIPEDIVTKDDLRNVGRKLTVRLFIAGIMMMMALLFLVMLGE